MSYDKYQNWPLPLRSGSVFPVMQSHGINEQVLKDLAEAEDEIERLELLDSFAAYAERAYRHSFAENMATQAGLLLGELLNPFILSHLPVVSPVHRGRPAKEEKLK